MRATPPEVGEPGWISGRRMDTRTPVEEPARDALSGVTAAEDEKG